MGTEIGANVVSTIENPDELVVPTITLYEVFKKLFAINISKTFPAFIIFRKLNSHIQLM